MNAEEIQKRVEIRVYGLVQGVFFRSSTKEFARKLGIKGTVRNVYDGSVEIIAEGTERQLNNLIGFAKRGPPSAKVYNVDVKWLDAKNEMNSFKIVF